MIHGSPSILHVTLTTAGVASSLAVGRLVCEEAFEVPGTSLFPDSQAPSIGRKNRQQQVGPCSRLTGSETRAGTMHYSHYQYTIDTEINGYIFIWSSCCTDKSGNIISGLTFIQLSKRLKHTLYNVLSLILIMLN